MMSVEEARERIIALIDPVETEDVALTDAIGRVLAEDVAARRTQPPAAVSAMDGYAVIADGLGEGAVLKVIGEAPAGRPFDGRVGPGEAVRIFTGGLMPAASDTIVIQENTIPADGAITLTQTPKPGEWVRKAGLDFAEGEVMLKAGHTLTARDIGLAAAMNVIWLVVRRRPRVAILATGDEIVRPGDPLPDGHIVSSNAIALAAFVTVAGGLPQILPIARDDMADLKAKIAGASAADLVLTTGGASVGDHDLVHKALQAVGADIDFWKIAMRPGKPLMMATLDGPAGRRTPLIGLPGNPVSAAVCALIFARPALAALVGQHAKADPLKPAVLGVDLGPNGDRQDFMRATLEPDGQGQLVATPYLKQDSSQFSRFASADCLVVRYPHDPAKKAGDPVRYIDFAAGSLRF
ncbi:MAG: molybdopterin molybdotransferase MoeA [Alphaproteobacteria bacterium]|nr:molybdopterin molybdotransferase MoeA [Alphaproteobacteria bacterium]